MKLRLYIALLSLGSILLGGLIHYFNWDNQLLLVMREYRTPEHRRTASVWLDRYIANLQNKTVPSLLDAEISGLTWHVPTHSLFAISGKIPKLTQLTPDGDVLREITLKGVQDPESIESLSDGRFALVDERTARLYLFDLPKENNLDLRQAVQIDLASQDTILRYPDNKGIEGLVWDARHSRFILAKESQPHKLYSLEFDLATNQPGKLTQLPYDNLFVRDISGLELDHRTGHLLVLSHESNLLLELDNEGRPVSFMSFLGGFNALLHTIKQAEGVAISPQGTLYIASEPNLLYRFTPKTTQTPTGK